MEQNQPQQQKKEDPMDIDVIIDRIDKLPIPDTEKASLLNQIKQNMMNPSHGEDENLNRIQSKYMPSSILANPHIQYLTPPPNQSFPQQFYSYPMQLPQYPPQYPQQPSNIMTTAHFEILKNKLDAVQLELVDLLRHVKDYTQRYMNATRQQDMEKIDAYVNGLFEVDKKMKEADEKAKEYEAEAEEEEPDTRESIIGKATSGIKNFIGSIGDNVAGVASLVSNTANIANNYLSKKVIGSEPTSNASVQSTTSKITGNVGKSNKNIISVDDYIQSNMNEMEGTTTTNSTSNLTSNNNSVRSNMNNINLQQSLNTPAPVPAPASDDDITTAINKLNDTMNEDIDNIIQEGEKKLNTPSSNPQPSVQPISNAVQSGGKRETRLTKRIRLLRLKLTKNKLEKELKLTMKNFNLNSGKHKNKHHVNQINSIHKNKHTKKR